MVPPAARHESQACAALLMLDVASAKASLAQLQQACQAASEDHLRTKCELQDLKHQHQQPPCGVLYASSSASSSTAAQQLQALHTENLQLKACLRQEVKARQQLEQKHAVLLDLLRSGNMVQLLAAAGTLAPAAAGSARASQQHWTRAALLGGRDGSTLAADACEQPDQQAPAAGSARHDLAASAHAKGAAASGSTGGSIAAARQPPGRTTSSSSYSSSLADAADSAAHTGHHQQGASSCAVDSPMEVANTRATPGGSQGQCPSSAYFPPQLHNTAEQQPLLARVAGGISVRRGVAAHSPAAAGVQGLSTSSAAPAAAGAAHTRQPWQHEHEQRLQALHRSAAAAQERQQRRQQQQEQRGATHAAAEPCEDDSSSAGGTSPSTSSRTRSPASELLDSSDLDELAGLCDSLLQRPYGLSQQQQHTAGGDSPGSGSAPCAARQQQQPAAGSEQAPVPGLQALAAQLRQLQEQVAATAQDTFTAQGALSAGGGGSNRSSSDRHASSGGAADHADAAAFVSTPPPPTGARRHSFCSPQQPPAFSNSSSLAGQQPGGAGDEGMVSLQQQLASRMLEVKQRLSNLCNGMLQDGPAPGQTPPKAAAGVISPPASPPFSRAAAAASSGAASVVGAAAAGRLHGTQPLHGRQQQQRPGDDTQQATPAGFSVLASAEAIKAAQGSIRGGRASAGDGLGRTTTSSKAAARAAAAAGIKQAVSAAAAATIAAGGMARVSGPGARQALFGGTAGVPAPAAVPAAAVAAAVAQGGLVGRAAAVAAAWGRSERGGGSDAADDSDDSWATVDDEGNGPRERGERHEQQQQDAGRGSSSNEGHAMSQNEPAPAERRAFGQQEIERDVMSSPPQPRQFSPQQQYGSRARDQECAASPVSSCEGGAAASAAAGLKGRVPAEVVFSPLKMGLAAGATAAQRTTPAGGTTSSGGDGRAHEASTGSTPLSKPRAAAV